MKKTSKTNTATQLQSSANVVDGKLILSLPDACTPVVWQMDLDETKTSALEIQEDKKKKQFILSLKTANSEITEIAPYGSKEEAIFALMEASKALQNAQTQIKPAAVAANQQGPMPAGAIAQQSKIRKSSKATGPILAFLMIAILVAVWALSITQRAPSVVNTASRTSATAGANEAGVAISADDFLSRR